jgi:hypothetical protein
MSVDLTSDVDDDQTVGQYEGDTGGSFQEIRIATAEDCQELYDEADKMRIVAATWEIPVNNFTQPLLQERDDWCVEACMLLSLLAECIKGGETRSLASLEDQFVPVLKKYNKIQETIKNIQETKPSRVPKRAASDASPNLDNAKKAATGASSASSSSSAAGPQVPKALFQEELPGVDVCSQAVGEDSQPAFEDSQPAFEDSQVS